MCGLGRQRRQPVQVRVRHHHYVPRRIWIRVQADEAVFSPQNQPRRRLRLLRVHAVLNCIINGRNQVAKHAALVARPGSKRFGNAGPRGRLCRGNVAVAPGSPEMIHRSRAVPISSV